MDEEKKFPRVGARNIRVVGYKETEVKNSQNCYCPACGGGPLDGCTGICMQTDAESSSDNSFGFDSPAGFNLNNDPNSPDFIPGPGDPSICCYCATLITYQEEKDGTLSLRLVNRTDMSRLKSDPDAWRGMMKMKEFVEVSIERAKIMGDKRYAGKTTKYTI